MPDRLPPDSSPARREVHIAGVLVQFARAHGPRLEKALSRLPRTEICAAAETGKLVLVCECDSTDQTLALIGRIRDLPGVLNVALVYQHAESAEAMDEEISDETDPPGIH